MKILTVLGTRPEIIRLSLVIELLDRSCDHILVHTGQNYDERLNEVFFRELGVRDPDHFLGVRAHGAAEQVGQIFARLEPLLLEHRPDRLLVLGDTNSGLSAIIARRLGIPVYHMEAGNRCFDDRVPEEVNRRVIDHASTVLLPYTERSRDNLLREGFPVDRVLVTGNPIKEVIDRFLPQIDASDVLERLGVESGRYFLVTMHRAETVDLPERLRGLISALTRLCEEYDLPLICSLHPRTKARAEQFGLAWDDPRLKMLPPLGFFDFVSLERSAYCVLSDSGTVQEEACIFGVPNVTIRDVTERPETVECGSNYLAGTEPAAILRAVRVVTAGAPSWEPPPEYVRPAVAETVCRILLSYRVPDRAEVEWRAGVRIPAR